MEKTRMKPIALASTLVLFSVFASPVTSANNGLTGALPVPANRIVGLWTTEAMVGPCGIPPVAQIRNTLLFHAGGTVVENPRSPPTGANGNQRNQALGTWKYSARNRTYTLHLRFDNFVNGVYEGYSTVDREMELSKDGTQVTGEVTSNRYLDNGTLISSVCGNATSTRL